MEKPKTRQKTSWWRKPHIVLGLSVGLFLVLVTTVQMFYPSNTALPYARIGDTQVGNKTYEQVVETLRTQYEDVPLTLTVPNKDDYETTTVKAGILPGYRSAAQAVTEYSLTARLVPFSFAYKMLQNPSVGYEVEELRFKELYEEVKALCQIAPVDAKLTFEGDVQLVSAKDGQECREDDLRSSLQSVGLRADGVSLAVGVVPVEPKRSDTDLRSQLMAARQTIDAGVTVRTSENTWEVPKQTIASWLTTQEIEGELRLTTDKEKIKKYLDSLRGDLYIAPGVTNVRYEDGEEVSRTTGDNGQGIERDVTAQRVTDVLLGRSETRTAWVQLTVLSPRLVVERDYTKTARGLQALLKQWDREHAGRYGLLVRDLSGRGISGSVNADMDFVTASTFKMFLAYAVLEKVEKDQLSMGTQTDIGLSVRACIDEMIVNSTNACALSLFNLAGWSYVHNFIRGQFPNTSLDNGANVDDEKHTTVRDEADFLQRLNAGQLMNGSNTNYLLGLMKRQIYRGGIPSGVPGVTVANKVGFYNGYKHDVAIVYAPKGAYILAILSNGGSDAEFADLSRKVYALLDR